MKHELTIEEYAEGKGNPLERAIIENGLKQMREQVLLEGAEKDCEYAREQLIALLTQRGYRGKTLDDLVVHLIKVGGMSSEIEDRANAWLNAHKALGRHLQEITRLEDDLYRLEAKARRNHHGEH